MARKRHLSRIAVMQVLFEQELHSTDEDTCLDRNIDELIKECGDVDKEFAISLLHGVIEKQDDLKKIIQKDAPNWPLDQMDPISRVILLISTYEIRYGNDAPPAVVMNEAIDIAKEYGTAERGKFVNGVLNAIAHH